ncbi:serine/threonine-protein kinase TAO1 [Aphelenchoides avenae]|nr:serine/threonine-protein kinase TAO1 [Aphelenchus avenae]
MYCVVMDKMEGSVADLIRHNRGYLTDEQTRVILGCTAKGLAYLHKMGFVHRDVKSDNVLVGRNCEVKLADLDSAAAERSLTGTAGTPHWVAPEIARIVCKLSTDPYTAKVDVWSFAIFATEFVLGVPPFFTGEEQPTAEVCGTICNPQYVASVNDQVRRAGLPDFPDVVRLVEFCLKAEPSQRPSMSDILIVMAFLGEPDQQVLLEPIQRMVHRREPEDGQDSNESQ